MRDLLFILFKHKYKICAVFFVVNLVAAALTFGVKPVYMATSSLLLRYGREYVHRPELGVRGSLMYLNRDQSEPINSEIQILLSRELIGDVIASVGEDEIYPDIVKERSHDTSFLEMARLKMEQILTAIGISKTEPKLDQAPSQIMNSFDVTLRKFTRSLTVERVRKSDVIKISFEHTDPRLAARITNQLVEFFKQKHLDIYGAARASSFLEDRMKVYREKIEVLEEEIELFRSKNNIFSIEKRRDILLEQHTKLTDSYESHVKDIEELQKKMSELQRVNLQNNQEIPLYLFAEQDTIIQNAHSRLLDLKREKQKLQKRYKDEHPGIIRAGKEIQSLKIYILKRIRGILSDELRLKKNETYIEKKKLLTIDKELKRANSSERVFQNLQHELETNKSNYQLYVAKLEETRISEQMEVQKKANVKVIEFAAVPVMPAKPRKMFNLAIGFLFSAFAAVGLAIFVEYGGQRLSTKESAERLVELPVLTTVSYRKL